jgi:hypothetical protein
VSDPVIDPGLQRPFLNAPLSGQLAHSFGNIFLRERFQQVRPIQSLPCSVLREREGDGNDYENDDDREKGNKRCRRAAHEKQHDRVDHGLDVEAYREHERAGNEPDRVLDNDSLGMPCLVNPYFWIQEDVHGFSSLLAKSRVDLSILAIPCLAKK